MPKKGQHVLPLGKIKSYDLWKLDFDFRKNLKDNSECARTMGYYFTSGVVDWRQWCQCKNNCGKKWTYGWITNLRAKYLQQTKANQLITLMQLVVKENDKYKYQLMDSTKKKHQVCHYFFCKVYQISVTTILKKLKEKKDQPISSSPEKKQGMWNRDENWKGKVSVTEMLDWIKKQPKEFSHYTRRLDQKSKKYFVDMSRFLRARANFFQHFIFFIEFINILNSISFIKILVLRNGFFFIQYCFAKIFKIFYITFKLQFFSFIRYKWLNCFNSFHLLLSTFPFTNNCFIQTRFFPIISTINTITILISFRIFTKYFTIPYITKITSYLYYI